MKKIVLLCFLSDFIFTHMCHDPFRPTECLIISPEKDIKIEKSGEFRVYIENTFQTTLKNLRLIVENPAFEISIEPEFLEKVSPGERSFFLVKMQLKEGYAPKEYSLRVSVAAESAEIIPSVEKISVTAIDEPKKLEEKKPLLKEEVVPRVRVKEPALKEEIFLQMEKKQEVMKITPLVREELKVERKLKEDKEITVKVEKIPFWKKPYFYVLVALFLIILLIWRKLKYR